MKHPAGLSPKPRFPKLRRVALFAVAVASLLFVAAVAYESANQSQAIRYKAPAGTWTAMTKSLDFSKPDLNEVELRRAIQLSEGIPHRKPGKK
jgi:hypothetical protein